MNTLTLPSLQWPDMQSLLRLRAAWQRWLQVRRERAEFAQLDSAALRDLGMDGSEYLSYGAESEGRAARSRRRLSSLY